MEWFEDEAFWRGVEPILFTAERLERTPLEVEGALALLGPRPGGRLLDLCCGPGRHSLELARRGFEVVGVDRTASFLGSRSRSPEAEPSFTRIRADMRAFRTRGGFDGACLFYSSFGYFEDPEDDRRVLRNLHASLVPGAGLLIDMKSREIARRDFEPERRWTLADGARLVEEAQVLGDWDAIETRWTWTLGGQSKEFRFRVRLYPEEGLKRALEDAGFGAFRSYGWWDGAPYDGEARRLVAVARR